MSQGRHPHHSAQQQQEDENAGILLFVEIPRCARINCDELSGNMLFLAVTKPNIVNLSQMKLLLDVTCLILSLSKYFTGMVHGAQYSER